MDINQDAPVSAERSIEIRAEPGRVWDVLADVERWPRWNTDVQSVELSGPLTEGSVFRWKSGRTTITSTFRVTDRPRELAWTGKAPGVNAIHTWRFEERDGATHVWTAESFEGFLARLLRGRLQKTVEGALENGLATLKAEVERGTG